MRSRQARLAALLPLLSLCSFAQANKLIVHPADPITATRGSSVSQTLEVGILPGFHVNSDKPKDEFLIPLKLTWQPGPLEARDVTYPKPEEITVGKQPTMVFSGDFHIATTFQVPAKAPTGSSTMTGKLRYQACNDLMCFRPATVEVKVPVSIK